MKKNNEPDSERLSRGYGMNRRWRWSILYLAAISSISLHAEELPQFRLEIRDHLFYPPEFEVPANKKIRLLVINSDATPEEFESYELNREKVIMGGASVTLFIGPLPPGQYPFFGEFNPKTAQGKIIAVDNNGKP